MPLGKPSLKNSKNIGQIRLIRYETKKGEFSEFGTVKIKFKKS